jgi:cell division protein FtsW (lipid II flippase)
LFGRGYGHSTQKFGFLPEPVGDSIFAVIGEDLGLVGACIVLTLFGLLCFFLTQLARQTQDKFARLYVMGVALWIMSQMLINIAAASGVGPLTGLPLPFISFGGTALIALLASLGIVLNIAKRI